MEQILMSIGLALGVSLIIYFKKLTKDEGEKFSYQKVVRTIVIGGILGVVSYQQGFDLNMTNYPEYAMANVGVIALADQVLAGIWRFLKSRGRS